MIQQFEFHKTNFEGVYLINPFYVTDNRGMFLKDYSKEIFQRNGIEHELKEVFYTYSEKGVIRAIHFQRIKEQPKLVRCVKGRIFDVVVDLRPDSKTYGQWQGFDLSDKNNQELLIPAHFGHGYYVIEPAIVSYKCAEKFWGEYDDGIIWNDPDINIVWPLDKNVDVILSDKDRNLQTFKEFSKQVQL